ncbi:MAG TPA: sensor histidine kinase [Paenibacillus cookii]|uniref:histidine kinase n=1 Tax=Paenibacillus cookii TaxID=157839 RepID=A0ABQ4LY04_9BACL|nr:sensor histidine kinase [Paenibacillus cookii]GIO68152.1 sensor histidine kinase YesM [Paenibacillus cookii]HWO55634.1 sensor histidine kinase [Paenibacillus cookii]
MIKRFRGLAPTSIRRKLMLAMVVCVLVPASLTLIVYNSLTQQAVKKQAIANVEDSLMLVHGSVSNRLKSMLNIANYIQINSGLRSYFKLVASGNDEGSEYDKFTEWNRVLEQLDSLTAAGEKSYVTVLLSNGSYFMNYSVSDYNPLNLLKTPWFEHLKELNGVESYWIGPEPTAYNYDKFDHPYQISVARTLRLDGTGIYGYVVVTMMEDQLHQIYGDLSADQKVLLLDEKGVVISSADPKQVGTVFPYADADGARTSTSIRTIGGQKHLVSQHDVLFTGWRLVLVQPYQDAIVNISSIFNRVFIFQLILFVLFALLFIALIRAFTKPLVRLGKVTSAVQRGNLLVRSGVRGNDEIGRLGLLFDQMLDRVQDMISEISETQARKRRAELNMLQAQIHPHFLFNVLNSIRMKVMRRGDPDSAQMIGSLSILLRMTISRHEDEISLHEEIDLVSHYVGLMNMRQKAEVALVTDIAPEAFYIGVPRFVLQPIVENAIIHGLKKRDGEIRIRAKVEAGFVRLSIEDNGQGMAEAERLRVLGKLRNGEAAGRETAGGNFSGIGLENVAERMRLLFGEAFRADVFSCRGAGTVIEMHIPLREGLRDVSGDAGG